MEEVESDIQFRAFKEQRHNIEKVKVLHKVARATGRINLSTCQAHEEMIEVENEKKQVGNTVA